MIVNRRDFVKVLSGGLVAGLALPFPERLPSGWIPPRRRGDFTLLRRNVGIFTARGGTMGWLVNDDGIVVVDAQYPDTAAAFLEGLPGRANRAMDVLINTHHHADHTAGNDVLRGEVRGIVAHRRARELHEAAGGDRPPRGLADTAFTGEWRIRIGDERVLARHLTPAHTGGDCTVRFAQANVVHMGDLVFNRAYPFIDREAGASVRGWLHFLEAEAADADTDTRFIFGHAREGFGVTGDRSDLRVQADFLQAILDQAEQAIREGRSRDDLLAAETIPGFPDHRPIAARLTAGLALATAFDELVEEG
ncbi:MAG: MBL fold metallo-hydrolase [Gemmatimonadales bacterium]|nr:MAG: MBL fold metallo-hydrolase [Gemmatimonadales bacterium]